MWVKVFALSGMLVGLSLQAQARDVPPALEHTHRTCLDLNYPDEVGGFVQAGKYKKAISACQTWRDYAAQNQPIHVALIDALRACHESYSDAEKAQALARTVLALPLKDRSYVSLLGTYLSAICGAAASHETKDWESAAYFAAYTRDLFPLDGNAQRLSWIASFIAGDFDLAVDHMETLVKLGAEPIELFSLAETYIKAGRPDEGVSLAGKVAADLSARWHDRPGGPPKPKKTSAFAGLSDPNKKQIEKDWSLFQLHQQKLELVLSAMAANIAGNHKQAVDALIPLFPEKTYSGTLEELAVRSGIPKPIRDNVQKRLDRGQNPNTRMEYNSPVSASHLAWQERAIALAGVGRYDEAMRIFKRSGAQFRDQNRYLTARATTHEALGEAFLAQAFREEAENHPPHLPSFVLGVQRHMRSNLHQLIPNALTFEKSWIDDKGLRSDIGKPRNVTRGKIGVPPVFEIEGGKRTTPSLMRRALLSLVAKSATTRDKPFIEILQKNTYVKHQRTLRSILPATQRDLPPGDFEGYKLVYEVRFHERPVALRPPVTWFDSQALNQLLEAAGAD